MKKSLKIALPILAVILVAAIGAGLYFAAPLLAMAPVETGEVPAPNFSIFALRSGNGNLYLVDTGEGWLMIDAGANVKSVEAGLGELGIHSSEVKWIFLTHTHGDHVAALPLFPHAKIYMNVNESKFALPAGTKIDWPLTGGEKIPCGDVVVECIAAPGHTPGSMLYRVHKVDWERSYLFTGDALQKRKAQAPSVHPFTQDKALAEQTISNLPTDVWMIMTSHYGYFPAPPSLST